MTIEQQVFLAIFGLGAMGLLVMIGMPRDWQNVQGWLLVSYIGLPLFVVAIALVVGFPILLLGLLFLLGVAARGK